jgi:hypothetical protein
MPIPREPADEHDGAGGHGDGDHPTTGADPTGRVARRLVGDGRPRREG